MGLLAPMRNAGPVVAAIAIAFNNDPQILGAVSGILLIGLVVGVPLASYLAKRRSVSEEALFAEDEEEETSTRDLEETERGRAQ